MPSSPNRSTWSRGARAPPLLARLDGFIMMTMFLHDAGGLEAQLHNGAARRGPWVRMGADARLALDARLDDPGFRRDVFRPAPERHAVLDPAAFGGGLSLLDLLLHAFPVLGDLWS